MARCQLCMPLGRGSVDLVLGRGGRPVDEERGKHGASKSLLEDTPAELRAEIDQLVDSLARVFDAVQPLAYTAGQGKPNTLAG